MEQEVLGGHGAHEADVGRVDPATRERSPRVLRGEDEGVDAHVASLLHEVDVGSSESEDGVGLHLQPVAIQLA